MSAPIRKKVVQAWAGMRRGQIDQLVVSDAHTFGPDQEAHELRMFAREIDAHRRYRVVHRVEIHVLERVEGDVE